MRVLIAGGGTGGHIYPGITIGKALQEKGASILFIGTRQGLEGEIIPREGFPIEMISVDYFPRRLSLRLVRSLFTALKGVREAVAIVKSFDPDICIGTGGYVAGPAVLAAALRGVPAIIQEQNAFPGLTNRWLARFAKKVALGYDEARPYFKRQDKLVFTGNPIRPEIVKTSRVQGAGRLGLRANERHVLIFGASQGARSINQAVLESLEQLATLDATFILVTGTKGFEEMAESFVARGFSQRGSDPKDGLKQRNVHVLPYIYDMPAALAVADLVVCRASAGSIAEVTAKGIPAILIPYPYAAENHQEKNARVLEAAGAAQVLLDRDVNGRTLFQSISSLLADRERMQKMSEAGRQFGRPDAVWDIVALVEGIVSASKRPHEW